MQRGNDQFFKLTPDLSEATEQTIILSAEVNLAH
jgi:hypothetical protein